jgi:hypothetical protein
MEYGPVNIGQIARDRTICYHVRSLLEDEVILSFDVENLFPNMPIDAAMEVWLKQNDLLINKKL